MGNTDNGNDRRKVENTEPNQSEAAAQDTLKPLIEIILPTLSEDIKSRLKLTDGYNYTLEEVGWIFGVEVVERLRYLERKASPRLLQPQERETQQVPKAKKRVNAHRIGKTQWSEQECADWENLDPLTIDFSKIDERFPKYRKKESTGEAYVSYGSGNRRKYLGEYDSPESKIAYHRLVSLWLKIYQKKYLPGRNYVPKYRLHKASGQAFVELSGKRIYCGKYGTPESKEKYDRLVEEWNRIPKYRLCKTSGKTFVVLSGKVINCGECGTPESKEKYDRLLEEWKSNGQTRPPESAEASNSPSSTAARSVSADRDGGNECSHH